MKLLEDHNEKYAARLKKDDQAAFHEIYRIYSKRLYNFVYSFLKNKELSEEVVQEAFLNLWINRAKLNESYPVGPLLFTIGRRLTLNALRQFTTSKASLEKLWQSITYLHNDTEETILLNNLQDFAETAYKSLPKQQQLVFRLSREEGLSYDEIADRLQISKNTVKNHLIAALKNLRAQFSRSDIVYMFLAVLSMFVKSK
ncbi:MAG: RNA polymerase sigma-70 factor [Mucilaginibacter sp.]|uniref:RNA polymerase sigma factor n=1 Tax=Mucilaginibacter sp. TaxID=1882438 RepID=UPI0031A2E0DD